MRPLFPWRCVSRARYGNSNIHNVAAVLGGVASQEAVKLITKQYIPMNNTFVFNGINGASATHQL